MARVRCRLRALTCGGALLAVLAAPAGAVASSLEEELREFRKELAEGDAEEALETLEDLDAGPLADHVALLRARLRRETGDLPGAIEAARRGRALDPPSELLAALHGEEAKAHLAQGDLLAGYRAQRAAWESTRSSERAAELAGEIARSFEEALLPGDALVLYRQTWMRWPLSAAAAQAYSHSRELEDGLGAAAPGAPELLRFADLLTEAGRCATALEIYERVLGLEGVDPPSSRRAKHARADCLFQLRRYEDAAGAYGALVSEEPGAVRAAIDLARSHARNGDVASAVQQLDEIASRSDPPDAAHARYLAAMLVGPAETKEASERLRLLEREKGAPSLVRLARWRLAWSDLQAGRRAEAAKRLSLLAVGDLFDVDVQRASYWLSVAELELGEEEKGREGLRRLAAALPLSYYGFLAAERLGDTPAREEPFLPPPRAPTEDRMIERAAQLAQLELKENASLELESRVHKGSFTREDRVKLARLLHEIEDHFRAVRILVDGFGGALEQGIDPAWREAWMLAWPRPYAALVKEAAKEFGADPGLLYAVMREESTYRPDAVSPVGALGLMQIMPPTGERIARGLGLGRFDAEGLFQPETSIRFGSYYLRELLQTFEGREPLAIAAYNAGPHVVATWARTSDPFALDAFVDSVPYDETRRYLRRVLRSYRVYGLLYGDGLTDHPPGST